MRRLVLAVVVVGICAGGCSRSSTEPVTGGGSPDAALEIVGTPYNDLVIGTPVSHANLTILPISSTTPKNDDRFITLDEGLAAGTVKIIEVGAEEGADTAVDEEDPFGP